MTEYNNKQFCLKAQLKLVKTGITYIWPIISLYLLKLAQFVYVNIVSCWTTSISGLDFEVKAGATYIVPVLCPTLAPIQLVGSAPD